ncbi:MAG: TonB-dependent receptor, partial [Bacteroidales bacterium]|nr:TonB-dependent receptor [Bacteroidales bacterium]
MPNKQIFFRQWSRKNYAVYNSIGKQIKICVLCFSCSILTFNTSAFATVSEAGKRIGNDDSDYDIPPDTILLEAALIQAPPKPMVSSLSRVVVSFDREDLQKLPIQNVQELLAYVGSIDLQQRGGQGVQADVRIRGGNFDQVMIMLNGVNFTDPQTGHHNLNLPIDLSSVERVEILQGPGARVLGANASSGAINIVTTASDTTSVGVKMAIGQHRFSDVSVQGNLIRNSLKLHASLGKSGSSGYIPNTDFDIQNAFLHVQMGELSRGEISLQSGYQFKAFGANAFYSHTYPDQYERIRTFINSLSYRRHFSNVNLQANTYHRRSFDRFDLFRYEAPAWYAGHNYHQSDVVGANIRSEYSYYPWKTTIGGDFRGEHIFSNVLGEDMSERRRVPFERDTVFFTREKWRTIGSWFVEQSFFASRWSVSVGAMGSYSNDFGHHTCFGTDVNYSLLPDWSLFASVNQALRLPTFTDLYYSSPTILGNANLVPERSNTFEVGSKISHFGLHSNVSAFYREGHNTIDWVRPANGTIYQSLNHTQINTFGFEADALYQFQTHHLPTLRVAYTFLNMSKNNLGMESGKSLEYLRHKFVANAHVNVWRDLHWSLGWVYQHRAGATLTSAGQPQNYAPISLFDTRLEWRTKSYQLF